jgi:hypothetical protein
MLRFFLATSDAVRAHSGVTRQEESIAGERGHSNEGKQLWVAGIKDVAALFPPLSRVKLLPACHNRRKPAFQSEAQEPRKNCTWASKAVSIGYLGVLCILLILLEAKGKILFEVPTPQCLNAN